MPETTLKVEEIHAVFEEIGELLHKRGITNAVVLLKNPHAVEEEPRIWYRGDFYEVAKLMAFGSTTVRHKMSQDLQGL